MQAEQNYYQIKTKDGPFPYLLCEEGDLYMFLVQVLYTLDLPTASTDSVGNRIYSKTNRNRRHSFFQQPVRGAIPFTTKYC